MIPSHGTAKAVDVPVPAASGQSRVVVVGFTVGAIVLVAIIIVVWQLVGGASPRPTAAGATTSAPVDVPAPAVTGSVPPPVKQAVFSYPAAPVKKEPAVVAPPAPPKQTPTEMLKPWRSLAIIYGTYALAEAEKDNTARKASWQAVQAKTVGDWLDWLAANPAGAPATVFLRDCPDRDRVIEAYENQTPKKEQGVLAYNDGKVSKNMRVTWFEYQDVAFAVDELRQVVAVRVDAWPAATPIAKMAKTATAAKP